MEAPLVCRLRTAFAIFVILPFAASADRDLAFCGTWRHGKDPLSVSFNVTPGCGVLSVSAGETSLQVSGHVAARCRRSGVHHLRRDALHAEGESYFCLYWEPLQDQLKLQVRGNNLTLCWPVGMPDSCCTYLSHGINEPQAKYGIARGTIEDDVITDKTLTAFNFTGTPVRCATFCPRGRRGSTRVNVTEPEPPCALSSQVEMKDDFDGVNIRSPHVDGVAPESATFIHLPPALKRAAGNSSKVVCTFFKNNSVFQEGLKEARILNDVVEISIEKEVIKDLPEPITIGFHHGVVPKTHSRTCVSWDTRKDPMKVKWSVGGCETQPIGDKHTECLCDHLTYFAVLVQLKPRPVRHLLALTAITSFGCALSFLSCMALVVFLCRRRQTKDASTPIHLGLAVSLAFLNLLFFLTGVLANVGVHDLCVLAGAGLHYALLSSFSWMGIEVFHTFWLVYVVFRPSPNLCVWNLLGFVVPVVPVVVLIAVGDIYGLRKVASAEDQDHPFLMCWMKNNDEALLAHYFTLLYNVCRCWMKNNDEALLAHYFTLLYNVCRCWMKNNDEALLAHYFTNLTLLAVLVCAGLLMLSMVYKEIRTRDEWRKNRVAFFSIWGLSCLYGTTWGLTFLDFGPLSDFVLFLSCILNSLQGFLLMLRFYVLDWMRKHPLGNKESPAKACHLPASQSTISQEPLEPLCPGS
ncbi:adhesion G-protein coupled receptor G1 isoform X2 [Entelurus aequoreus]|uniref:adhesion G-protein coupled receptor G1 isoform X2 n=1 Tax=Entelurus aequoreus TaxID=161455 RepID=UPI002B1D7107|nr:adhesion G-protein coupled receptor G1 isoform X2 [Entelurus aequoreus]